MSKNKNHQDYEDIQDGALLTDHARNRTSGRAISEEQIQRVINLGRETHERHATIYFVGNKEIAKDKSLSDCDGIHVVCAPNSCVVITTYRNKQYSAERYTRGQKPRREAVKRRYGR